MIDVRSLIAMPGVRRRRFLASARDLAEAQDFRPWAARSCWLHRGRPVLPQPFQIQDPADQVRFLLPPPAAAPPEAPQAVPVLGFPEQLLDQLPTALREPICLA